MLPIFRRCALVLLLPPFASGAQQDPALISSGQVMIGGRPVTYQVRHLPLSSFPELPPAIVEQLTQRECLIPQTYEARRPENVVHASLERSGSSDWAVLCSSHGIVSLLVIFGAAPTQPMTIATAAESQRVQVHYGNSVLGFDWGIDPATPDRVHEAQIGLSPRPRRLDHDALADSVVDRTTLYHYYDQGSWHLVDLPQ
jgi:hypothetical protein